MPNSAKTYEKRKIKSQNEFRQKFTLHTFSSKIEVRLKARKSQKEIVVSSILPKKRKNFQPLSVKSGRIKKDAMAEIEKTHSIIFLEN